MRQQLTRIDAGFPWLAQCLASIDYWELLASLAANDKAVQCWRKVTASPSPSQQELNDAYFRDYYCPLYVDTAMPCVNEVLVPAIQAVIGSTASDCCSSMKQRLADMLGLDLAAFVNLALKLVGNVICSEKTYFKSSLSQHTTQTCGYALATSFLSDNILDTILTTLQISNYQGCRAMTGTKFYTTQGMTAQFFANEGEEPLGVCYAPIDALLQQVSKLPALKTLILRNPSSQLAMYFSSLLGAGRCLRGSLMTTWLGSESEFVLVAATLIDTAANMARSFAGTHEWRQALKTTSSSTSPASALQNVEQSKLADAIRRTLVNLDTKLRPLCFHLSNSLLCTYNDSTLTLPFPQTSAGSISQSLLLNDTAASSRAAASAMHRVLSLWLVAIVWVGTHLVL